MSPHRVSLVLGIALLPALACTSSDDAHQAQPAPAASAALPQPAAPAETAPEPAATTPARVAMAPRAGELRFEPQPGWMVETPKSSMRKAQYRMPGEGGAADASLVVYHFGPGGGGGVEANLARWAGQFEQSDCSDSRAAMKSSKRTIDGLAVTEVDLAGTYVAETSPGSGEHVREEGWRMLAAIVEASEGAYYAKLVGPAATVSRWEKSYGSFLDAVGR
jgi:hypothetical protein